MESDMTGPTLGPILAGLVAVCFGIFIVGVKYWQQLNLPSRRST